MKVKNAETTPAIIAGAGILAKGLHDSRYRDLIGKLAAERKLQSISQRELADRLGRHQQFVSKYEIGERRLDIVEFNDVTVALGLNAADLLAGLTSKLGKGPTSPH